MLGLISSNNLMEVWPQLTHLTFSKTQHSQQTLSPTPVYVVEKQTLGS